MFSPSMELIEMEQRGQADVFDLQRIKSIKHLSEIVSALRLANYVLQKKRWRTDELHCMGVELMRIERALADSVHARDVSEIVPTY